MDQAGNAIRNHLAATTQASIVHAGDDLSDESAVDIESHRQIRGAAVQSLRDHEQIHSFRQFNLWRLVSGVRSERQLGE